jgi:competence protein ComEA
MTLTRTLWDFLDSRETDTTDLESAIVDTRDGDVEGAYFEHATQRVRWRVGITTGIALGAAVLLIVVGSFLFRGATPPVETVSATESSTGDRVTDGEERVAAVSPQVVVHIVGAVVRPGVIRVPDSSRVEDVLALAGGPTKDAELSGVNLARTIFDGEQIVVPAIGEEILAGEGARGGRVSLSRADSAALQTLPRVGPATAERIIAWRDANGPYRSVEDLLAVSGIGPATLEGLREYVTP